MLDVENEALHMLKNDSAIRLFNVVLNISAAQALHAAFELNLFEEIHHAVLTIDDLSQKMNLEKRPLEALLSACAGLELIEHQQFEKICLTTAAKNLLLKESPFYLGRSLELNLMNANMFSFKTLKKALQENRSQVYDGKELFQTNEEQAQLAKYFTHCMHGKSMGMAGLWPNTVDLSQQHTFLDIGGGSGAHSIGLVSRWPHLKAIVYDRPFVTEVASNYINAFGLEENIRTQIGDMWKDPFPSADIHFYSDIFHDWSLEQCRFLAQKSFDALKSKGRILIHEMLFNDDKTGPLSVASYNLMMLLWTEKGQQLSKKEVVSLLTEVGFKNVRVIPTGLGDWSLVEGQKP